MHITITVVSIALALIMAGSGAPKVLNIGPAQRNAAHLNLNAGLSRVIGGAELLAAAALLVGIFRVPALTVVTAVAIVALMFGALVYHRRADDSFTTMAPALLTALGGAALAAAALTRLH